MAAGCIPGGTEAGGLSARGLKVLSLASPFEDFAPHYYNHPHHATQNPKGVINLGIAENSLCADILTERLRRPDCLHFDGQMQYFPVLGTSRVRDTLAKFITKRFRASKPVDPDHVCVVGGGAGAVDLMSYLIANEDDYFLCMAPLYYGTAMDCSHRSFVKCHTVQLTKADNYKITREKLEDAYQEVTDKGGTVRGVMCLNPNNPLGDVYSVETLNIFLDFAHSHDIHIIFDEVYALSVHDPGTTFHSVLSLDSVPNPSKTHVLWGFSKDFGLSGFRTSLVIVREAKVRACLNQLVTFGPVPLIIQNMLATMLEDEDWLDTVYFPNNIPRIRESYEYGCERLDKMGIPYHPSKATFFIWADFTRILKEQTDEEDRALFECFLYKANVLVVSGRFQRYNTPGWVRITITHPRPLLEEAFNRIEQAVKEYSSS